MILSQDNAVDHLLGRRLITLASLVQGDLTVLDASRRNRNLKVIRRGGPSYFVKQPRTWNDESLDGLKREAGCYRLVQQHPGFSQLRAFLPKYYDFDAASFVLVVELLSGYWTVHEHHQAAGLFPIDLAARVGALLATWHSVPLGDLEAFARELALPATPPWMLSIHQLVGTDAGSEQLPSVRQFVRIVQEYPEYRTTLQMLRDGWCVTSLLHGDLRWDNLLVRTPHAETTDKYETHLKLIDWELAAVGDPLWDVGGVLQAYLTSWIAATLAPNARVASAPDVPTPLGVIKPATRAFWMTYLDGVGAPKSTHDELLERSVRYAAVRLLQTAYEHAVYSPEPTAYMLHCLQVSLNVFRDPGGAIADLLGL